MALPLVKWTPPVQALARQAAPAQAAAPDTAANAAPGPRQYPRSGLGARLVQQFRQGEHPQPAATDPHAGLVDARTKRAEESVAAMATLG